MKVFVCVEYYSYSFLLWDIRVRLVTSIETRKAFLSRHPNAFNKPYEMCRIFKIRVLYLCYWLK